MTTQKLAGFDNPQAAQEWSRDLQTITGYRFHVRPARPEDRDAMDAFFARLTPEDVYFRFLTPLPRLDKWRLEAMTRIDDAGTIDFLASPIGRDEEIIASAMLSADDRFETAELALATRPDVTHRGVSWTLLDHVSGYAAARGIAKLRAIHSSAEHDANALEREAGFKLSFAPDDATVRIAEKSLAPEPLGQA
jgi:acetyltransferase